MSSTVELIETFCSMHLAVNLRKAFQNSTADGKHNPVIPWYMSFANYLESAVLQNMDVEVVLMTFCQ